jgi:hypothetical protein
VLQGDAALGIVHGLVAATAIAKLALTGPTFSLSCLMPLAGESDWSK